MTSAPPALKLEPRIQHYAWGDRAFIPELLGRPIDGRPWAEAWYGAHPLAPSVIHTPDGPRSLDAHIATDGVRLLGEDVSRTFGTLPYLVKLLAAAEPLSIQVHPDAAQARAGFEREQAAGIALHAPHRNYRDPHHKPELIVALTAFHALCGFRPLPVIRSMLDAAPEIRDLLPGLGDRPEDLRSLLAAWFDLPDHRVQPALSGLLQRFAGPPPASPTLEFWVLKAQQALGAGAPPDRGLLFLFLLELRHLQPGQALFLEAGVPHAYLQGAGIEVMAASDNVLRAGLTPKHVDAAELLKVIRTGNAAPAVIEADATGAYATPAKEFEVQRLAAADRERRALSPELLLACAGGVTLEVEGAQVPLMLASGEACLIQPGTRYRLRAGTSVWRVGVPLQR
ncbi:MAG: mannose-6-phosphate isomerase, class I [Gammaproteobacteria bacterium]|nr:mannose-6-phosphate isomerase, class I [Gammaproteobacteria bacterium]